MFSTSATTEELRNLTAPPPEDDDEIFFQSFIPNGVEGEEQNYARIGGYDENWVSEPDKELECPICLCVVKNAVVTENCGHLFCSECVHNLIQRRLESSSPSKCPSCRLPLQEENVRKDLRARRTVQNFTVYCRFRGASSRETLRQRMEPEPFEEISEEDNEDENSNRSSVSPILFNGINSSTKTTPSEETGCRWQGRLKDLDEHLKNCEYASVECPEPGCSCRVSRAQLSDHLRSQCHFRTIQCVYCGDSFTAVERISHESMCPVLPIRCQLGCGRTGIARCDMDNHIKLSCPLGETSCPFSIYGCTWKGPRQNCPAHAGSASSTALHLRLVSEALLRTQEIVRFQSQQLTWQSGELTRLTERVVALECRNDKIESRSSDKEETESTETNCNFLQENGKGNVNHGSIMLGPPIVNHNRINFRRIRVRAAPRKINTIDNNDERVQMNPGGPGAPPLLPLEQVDTSSSSSSLSVSENNAQQRNEGDGESKIAAFASGV
eukprot:g6349.t1